MDAKLSKEEVRRAYRRYASTYDLWSGFAESRARERCLELAGILDGDRFCRAVHVIFFLELNSVLFSMTY